MTGQSDGVGRGAFGHGLLTDAWYFAVLSSALRPGRLTRVEMLGRAIALGRAPDGSIMGFEDVCPHRAAPLSAGRFVRDADETFTVECPYHGWRFRAGGACAAIPSLVEGQAFDPEKVRARAVPVAESAGMVFAWMAADPRRPGEPEGPPPAFPGADGPPRLADSLVMEAHVDHAAVGLMDPAHGPFVHQQWWWRSRASRHLKEKRFVPSPLGFTMAAHRPSRNSRAYAVLGGHPMTEIAFALPGYRWERVTAGRRFVLALTCLTPLDERRTRVTQLFWSDHPLFAVARPLIAAAARRFLRQDAEMVDLQKPGLAAGASLMWIDDADTQAKWYLALKREWAASRAEGRPFSNPVPPATLRWMS